MGENISLSVDFLGAHTFQSSGYENIITNSTYNGGVVRQSGNLSFSRIFEAGHYGERDFVVYCYVWSCSEELTNYSVCSPTRNLLSDF
jgi:hypothetical protein